MIKYTVARLLRAIVTVFAVVSIVFLLLRLMPESAYFEPGTYERLPEQSRIARLYQAGLMDLQGNRIHPLVQLFNYYKRLLLHGDLGVSVTLNPKMPVTTLIANKAPLSITLGLVSTVFVLAIGWISGLFAARFKDRAFDKFIIVYGALAAAIPEVVLILMLQLVITNATGWPLIFSLSESITRWFTPVIVIIVTSFAGTALWLRRYTVDQMNSDYVKLAYAKGVPSNGVFFGHILRNAFTPIAYSVPAAFLLTISGTLLVENAFGIPGMAQFFLKAINRRDNNIVQAVLFIYVTLGVLSVLLGDLLAAVVDPRIRLSGASVKAKVLDDDTAKAEGKLNG
ncbi:permease [Clostridia bacterium]|nr:permease [Clostridia bacterium]